MRKRHCPHARVRGIYGDEIIQRMRLFTGKIYRLECRDCGRLLDGPVSISWQRR